MSQNYNVKKVETANVNDKLNRSYGTTGEDTNTDDGNATTDILQATIGDFGRWQCLISLLMSLLKLPVAWFQLGIVFLAPPTEFWCKPPEEYETMNADQWKEFITPWNNMSGFKNPRMKSGCTMWDIKNTENRSGIIKCPWGYEYNRTQIHTNIITEWDLVCGQEGLVELTQITLMFGVLLGSLISGIAADKFGRRKVLIYTIVFQSLCGILSALSPWYWLFVLLRLLLAMANGGTMITSFVMCMEIVGGTYRTTVPILYQIPFGIGNTVMAVIAYFVRDWRALQLILSCLSSIFILYICIIPESPRWLLAVGRNEEAIQVLHKAARMNKISKSRITAAIKDSKSKPNTTDGLALLTALKIPKLRVRMVLLCAHWLLCGISFFGFSEYLGHLSTNIYIAVAVGGLIAIPGTFLCVQVVKTCGRRSSIACADSVTAFCFFAMLLIPQGAFSYDWPRITLAGVCVGGFSVSSPALYLFTSELFPTVVRNAGLGSAVMFSKLGSMLAPLIITMDELAWFIPLLVLGCLSVIEVFLVLPLPETLNTKLPDTIDDLEDEPLSPGTMNTTRGNTVETMDSGAHLDNSSE